MSKWTEIRDSIVEALQVEEVGHDLKTRFVDWLGDEGIAFVQPIADAIVDECKKDAPKNPAGAKSVICSLCLVL